MPGWEPCNLHDLGHVSSVVSVLCRSCIAPQNDRFGSEADDLVSVDDFVRRVKLFIRLDFVVNLHDSRKRYLLLSPSPKKSTGSSLGAPLSGGGRNGHTLEGGAFLQRCFPYLLIFFRHKAHPTCLHPVPGSHLQLFGANGLVGRNSRSPLPRSTTHCRWKEQATVRAEARDTQDTRHTNKNRCGYRTKARRYIYCSYLGVALIEHVGDRQRFRERSRQARAKREFHRLGTVRGDYPIATLQQKNVKQRGGG